VLDLAVRLPLDARQRAPDEAFRVERRRDDAD
jgi:hypothetical protein